MKHRWLSALILFAALLFYGAGCEEKKSGQQSGEDHQTAVLRKLYVEYQFGQIEQCRYNGKLVYHAGINAYDAGSQVYDSLGNSIGVCNYMARLVDSPCEKLTECEVLYRCENHISGEPAVDKFGVSDPTGNRQK